MPTHREWSHLGHTITVQSTWIPRKRRRGDLSFNSWRDQDVTSETTWPSCSECRGSWWSAMRPWTTNGETKRGFLQLMVLEGCFLLQCLQVQHMPSGDPILGSIMGSEYQAWHAPHREPTAPARSSASASRPDRKKRKRGCKTLPSGSASLPVLFCTWDLLYDCLMIIAFCLNFF